ncbi:polyketide cyclase [Chryseobacterium sp. T16E-39]|uniref:SRPBCC family protein n=1 Tax=Chryseobacterium sp. T16E-39 TaxID=2015076 RepID=UPI000B5B3597|nr:SRPBCC family protein [Chryseobacterium sp. T16E-39]ASK31190.1 polyketide cyclase [Chryseobacterium sp. T16E-39]
MTNNSVSLHRVIQASPEKVFRAFADVTAYASWIPPYGFICTVQQADFKEGGQFKMTFINFSTGNGHSFGGTYAEIREGQFLKYVEQFDDPALPGEMTTTVSFNKVSCGTEIRIEQTSIPEQIPAEMCYLGWQESLDKLKRLVEPEIPDA